MRRDQWVGVGRGPGQINQSRWRMGVGTGIWPVLGSLGEEGMKMARRPAGGEVALVMGNI